MNINIKIGVIVYIIITVLTLIYQVTVNRRSFEYAGLFVGLSTMVLIGIIVVNS